MNIRGAIKECLPPVFLKWFRANKLRRYGWFGDYRDWEEAKRLSKGYESGIILEKVKEASMKVKEGNAACERDSMLFKKIEYSWSLLAALMWIAADRGGRLNIIDFGGSLGTAYFQNRFFLSALKEVNWGVVEQRHFVECGKRHFEDDRLKFYETIGDCLKVQTADAILFSNAIQYVKKPYGLISGAVDTGFKYIVFDRTSFNSPADRDRLTIQRVNPDIYDASYPCWFFNEKRFLSLFEKRYRLVADFESGDRANIPSVFKGFIFKKKENV